MTVTLTHHRLPLAQQNIVYTCIRKCFEMPDARKHARLMMGAKPGRRSVIRARHWARREAALPRGLQRTPSPDLYAYRSMMTGGRVVGSDSLFVWRPTATRPSSPRETKKSPADRLLGDEVQTPRPAHGQFDMSLWFLTLLGWFLYPHPVRHLLPVVLRKAVRHPPKSSLAERMSPAELSRSFAYYLQCPQLKNRLF